MPILEISNLSVDFRTVGGQFRAVDGVSMTVEPGEIIGIVGESGSGKSVTMRSVMGILDKNGVVNQGEILYTYKENGEDKTVDILKMDTRKIRRTINGRHIAMIFQDPMTALNPVYSVGFQIGENLYYHTDLRGEQIRERSIDMLKAMGIPAPEQRVKEYPHQFSGGMRQRAMIAMAMACDPQILIADEPTTALDVTIQAQIFELIERLKASDQTAIMLITHDMGVVAELADDVIVMYMGNIVEQGSVDEVLRSPAHPYTRALLQSIPVLGKGKKQTIEPIRGSTPDPFQRPPGCQFAPRCDFATERCNAMPDEASLGGTHSARCWFVNEVDSYAK